MVVPVTAVVSKVVVPRNVKAPFMYTPGGPWDRSTQRPAMDTQYVSRMFNDRYVSRAELEESARKYYEARVKFDETIAKGAKKSAESAESARKQLSSAQARVSAAEAALTRLAKRKKPATAAEKRAAQDRLTAARDNLTRLQRQARSAPSTGTSGGVLSQAPKSIQTLIRRYAGQYKVDPNLVAAVMKQESGFKRTAKSPAGAMGLMQLMPGTARSLGVRDPYDAAQNIKGGVKYLAELIKTFRGDLTKVIAAYNAGPNAVRKAGGIPNNKETRAYVPAVMRNLGISGGSTSKTGKTSTAKAVASFGNPLVTQMIENAKKLVGRYYKWGGGHASNSHRTDLNKALVDCSGLINTALGHVLRRNVNRVAKDWTKGKGIKGMSVKEALNTPGAFLGTNGHVVMSIGGGRVIEAPQRGKKVRIRKASAREFSRAGWYTALGAPTKGAYTPGSGGGAVDAKTLREVTTERDAARKAYEAALKAYKTPAYVHLASATKQANTYSRAFLNNIKKIRDRGYPSLAYRLLEMGDEDGAVLAASLANAPAKVLRQQRDMFEQNAGLAQQQKDITDALAKTAGPIAWKVATRERAASNATWKKFLDNVAALKARGYSTLAAQLLEMGVDEGADIAATALRATPAELKNLQSNLAGTPEKLQKRQDDMARTMLGPLWKQNATSTAKATATSAAFLANIRTIRDRGFPGLALRLMEMGEDDAGEMAAEAAKATTADLTGWDKTHEASKAITDQTQRLLDELRGVGETLNVTVGLATGGEPVVRYTAARPVDARPATVPFYAGPPRSAPGGGGPLLHVENMYAANPSQAATQLETRLGDAVAVSGIGRVI